MTLASWSMLSKMTAVPTAEGKSMVLTHDPDEERNECDTLAQAKTVPLTGHPWGTPVATLKPGVWAESARPKYDHAGGYMARMTLRTPSATLITAKAASTKLRLKLGKAAVKSKSTRA